MIRNKNSDAMTGVRQATTRRRSRRGGIVAISLVGTIAALTACSSSGSSSSSSAAGGTSAASAAATASASGGASACAQAAAQQEAQLSQPTKFAVPTTPVKGSLLKGKTIADILPGPSPASVSVSQGVQQAAKVLGAKALVYTSNGSVTDYNNDIKLAITAGATYFVMTAENIANISATMAAAGPGVHFVDFGSAPSPTSPLIAGDFAHVGVNFSLEGKMQAIGVLAATDCKANVLAYTEPALPSAVAISNSAVATIKSMCPACTVKLTQLQYGANASSFQNTLQTDLTADPSANYVMVPSDAVTEALLPVLEQAKVPVAGINCDTPVLPLLAKHSTLTVDVCQPPFPYIGFTAVDELLRAAAGQPSATPPLPEQLISATTTFDPSNEFPDFGDYESAYEKLWGVS
jgi:ribose transport system substrate-binding protein